MSQVSLEHVGKVYPGNVRAVTDANLIVADKEFVVLVGPSGCGKSTVLRMIAGLEDLSEGTIRIGDRVVNDVAPKDRDVAMVFQNYALYPHMNVFDNLAFGLKMRKVPRPEIEQSVKAAAGMLGISDLLDRRPGQLSGGQSQRVAVGRAIVRRPAVFLFDEPLSNLDALHRVEMRRELARLHDELQATMIFVTHDQVEAMTLGTRIVVMQGGTIQQIGPPLEIYNRPVNRFVAGFVGTPPMNFISGQLETDAAGVRFRAGDINWLLPAETSRTLKPVAGKAVTLGIRPEDLHLSTGSMDTSSAASLTETVTEVQHLGGESLLFLRSRGEEIVARIPARGTIVRHSQVTLYPNLRNAHLFDSNGKNVGLTSGASPV